MQFDNIWWWFLHLLIISEAIYHWRFDFLNNGSKKKRLGPIWRYISYGLLPILIWQFGWINLLIVIIEWIVIPLIIQNINIQNTVKKIKTEGSAELYGVKYITNREFVTKNNQYFNEISSRIPLLKLVNVQNRTVEAITDNATKMFKESRSVLKPVDYCIYLNEFLKFKSDYWENYEFIKNYSIEGNSELDLAIVDYKEKSLRFFMKYGESLDLLIEQINVGVKRTRGIIKHSEFAKKFWAIYKERDLVIKELDSLNFDESLRKVEDLCKANPGQNSKVNSEMSIEKKETHYDINESITLSFKGQKEEISKKDFPQMYQWAKDGPQMLIKTVNSMVEKGYKGDLEAAGMCLVNLEMDFEHQRLAQEADMKIQRRKDEEENKKKFNKAS